MPPLKSFAIIVGGRHCRGRRHCLCKGTLLRFFADEDMQLTAVSTERVTRSSRITEEMGYFPPVSRSSPGCFIIFV